MYESWHSTWVRSWAMDECLEHIKADDQFTHCISIGPVSPSRIVHYSIVSVHVWYAIVY